jgi:proteasome lid subunit RPN8/RPN11
MDPREQLNAVKDLRSRGLTPLGNWHSHPDTPSRPSQEDIRLAHDPSASYLILSLQSRRVPNLNAFRIQNGAYQWDILEIYD